jgi:hypothetical protein
MVEGFDNVSLASCKWQVASCSKLQVAMFSNFFRRKIIRFHGSGGFPPGTWKLSPHRTSISPLSFRSSMSDLLRFQPAGTPPPVSQRLFFGTRRSIISSIASKLQQSTESARVIAEEQPSQASLMIEPSISLSSSVSTLLPTDSSSAIIEPVTDSNINITQQIVDRVAALEIEQSNQSNDAPKTIPASLAAIGLTRAASKEQFDALQTLFDGDLELSSLTLKQTELKSGSIRVQMSLAHFDIDEIHQNLDGFSRDCVGTCQYIAFFQRFS